METVRPRLSHLLFSILIITAIALTLSCGANDDNNTQQGSESALCGDIDALDSAIGQVTSLSTASSLGDVSQALSNLASAASDVKTSLREVKDNNDNQVQGAVSNLEQALITAVNSGSLSQNQAQIRSAADQLTASLNDAKNDAKCSS